ncbi:MAG: hypothetical protein V3U80_06405 [Flavobacteriaceae bacterium]
MKSSIIAGAFYFIYQKMVHNDVMPLSDFIIQLEQKLFTNYKALAILFTLTFFNWFFEILKWKNLVSNIKKISLLESFKQSLGSLTASLFTPNRIGEYGAKAFYYYKDQRKKIMLLNLVSNVSQMTITLAFGVWGLLYFLLNFNVELPLFRMRRLIYIFALLIASFFGGRVFISKKIRGFYLDKIIKFIKNLSGKIVFTTLLFSIIRYVIFSHQFFYLLNLFGVEVDYYTLMMLIFTMYLLASVIPSLPMFDWLIKGSVAVFVFSFIQVNEMIIVTISSLMWLFNFAIPSIIGSYFIMNFKYIGVQNKPTKKGRS